MRGLCRGWQAATFGLINPRKRLAQTPFERFNFFPLGRRYFTKFLDLSVMVGECRLDLDNFIVNHGEGYPDIIERAA